MSIKLNQAALKHARQLIKDGNASHDARDDWSGHAPDAGQENAFIKDHGFAAYAKWHLGEDETKTPDTKGRYSFPYGDFSRLHRCAILAVESRAAQNDYDDIARACRSLLEALDRD